MMAESKIKWNSLCVGLRPACYLAVLYNLAVFAANLILYINDRPSWQDDSNTEWVRWQWIDLVISGISILAAMLLIIAIMMKNLRLLQVFLIWTVVCIVLSIMVLGFGFGELERPQIVARCVGIVVSAYFADVIFCHYLNVKQSRTVEGSPQRQSCSLESNPQDFTSSDMSNGGFHMDEDELTMIEMQNNIRNVRLWYEDTKF